jgi:hypothetical protein
VADVIDVSPRFALRATGDLVEARARIRPATASTVSTCRA